MNRTEIIEHAKHVASLMGWHIETIHAQIENLSSDGVVAVGVMWPVRNCVKEVKAVTSDPMLLHLAAVWQHLQKQNSHALEASVTYNGMGYQSMAADFTVYSTAHLMISPITKNEVKSLHKRFCDWLYHQLRNAEV